MAYTPADSLNMLGIIATRGYRETGTFYFEVHLDNVPNDIIIGIASSNYGFSQFRTRIGEQSDSQFTTYGSDRALTFGINVNASEPIALNDFLVSSGSPLITQTFTPSPVPVATGDTVGVLCDFIADAGYIGVTGGTIHLFINNVEVASMEINSPGVPGFPDFRPAVSMTINSQITGKFRQSDLTYTVPGNDNQIVYTPWDPTDIAPRP